MTSERPDPAAPSPEARAGRRHRIPLLGRDPEQRPAQTDLRLCPFLATASGTWRAAFPAREHECAAVAPTVPLAMEKQRRLCLTEAYRTCATFVAGTELRARIAGGAAATQSRRPVPSTTPVLLERARSSVPLPMALPDTNRASGQVLLVALLVIAFVAIAIARFGSSGSAGIASSSPSASPVVSGLVLATDGKPTASPSAVPTPSSTPAATPRPSPSPSSVPTPSPSPKPTTVPATPRSTPSQGTRTYTVKFGDTLSSIAQKFGVTVAAIQQLNGIKDPRLIHPGEVLQIP